MLSAALKERLGDPAYLELHIAAVSALAKIGEAPWYDAHFLKRYEAAKAYLANVRPDALQSFIDGFDPIRLQEEKPLEIQPDFYPPGVHERIREVAAAIPRESLEEHELEGFGRHIVHNHDFFSELQLQVQARVEDIAGRKLMPGYNFLSMYGGTGNCALHMDEPESMYTLDYCIDQNAEWPIYFSNQVNWPDVETMKGWQPSHVFGDPSVRFTEHLLQPNQALLFTGSSRWHYRNAISPDGFCNLLFFHYYPADCHNLVYPKFWAEHFDIAELGPLCDIFHEVRPATQAEH